VRQSATGTAGFSRSQPGLDVADRFYLGVVALGGEHSQEHLGVGFDIVRVIVSSAMW
jgi:hypothetical protein